MTVRSDTDEQLSGHGRGDMLDLSALWVAIKRRKAWIIVPTVTALGLSFVAVNLVTARYTGEARLLLENRDSFYTRPGQGAGDNSSQQFDSEGVQSQVQLIMSRDLAREAIKRIGLVGNPEFDSGAGSLSMVRKLGVMIGLGSHPADRSPEERVLEKYYDRLLVYPVGRSRIVAVEFTSQDPAVAARSANAIASAYLELQEAAKQDTARSASSWLSTTIEPLRRRVADAEAKVEDFRSRNGLLMGANNTTITAQQLADLSTQLSSARTQQAEAQAKAGIIRDAIRSGRTFDIPDVANNELVRRLVEQRVNLKTQIALESRNLLSEHPRIKELNAQLLDLETQLRSAAERAVRTLENEARIAGQRVESFTAALDGQKKNVSSANDSEVQLRALEREARTLREQLEQYMIRYREAVARDTLNATPADARIVSRAVEPTAPSFPKRLPTVLVATLAAFFVSLALVVARELMSGQSVAPARKEPELAPEAVLMPVDAEPFASDEIENGPLALAVDFKDPDRVLADLAAQADPSPPGMARMLMLLDDAGTDDARRLGALMAQRCRCILVDMSGEREHDEPGFSELLSGEAIFSDVIMREPESNLHRIGVGKAGRAAVLAAPDLLDLALDALCETYDWVLVAASSEDEDVALAPMLGRCQGVLVVAGSYGVETSDEDETQTLAAIALSERMTALTPAPVLLLHRDYDEQGGSLEPHAREDATV